MKIVYISSAFIPSQRANSIHTMKICQAFADNGHDVTLIYPSNKRIEKITDNIYYYYNVKNNFKLIKIRVIGKGRIKEQMFGIKCIFKIIIEKPDIIYSRSLSGTFYASLLKYKFIFEAHQPYLRNKRNIYRFFQKKILNSQNLVRLVVISEALKNKFLEDVKNDVEFITAHDGADEINLNPLTKKILGRTDILQLGYFGSLYSGRGIEIIYEMTKLMPDIDFHIYGGSENIVNFWKTKSTSISNLHFHGFIAPNQVHIYLNSCDILLAPYQKEVYITSKMDYSTSEFMSPLKIFEYMAVKKPIIASDLTVLREILNESNSMLVTADDINAWIEAINILRDKNIRNKIANKAHNDFINNYTWKIRTNKVLSGIVIDE
jgi:glycosyltransferase involved in cell wall biosynthesis